MFNPSMCERIKHKLLKKTIRYYAPIKRKRLNNTDFSIISNNCWGGLHMKDIVYKSKAQQWDAIYLQKII